MSELPSGEPVFTTPPSPKARPMDDRPFDQLSEEEQDDLYRQLLDVRNWNASLPPPNWKSTGEKSWTTTRSKESGRRSSNENLEDGRFA